MTDLLGWPGSGSSIPQDALHLFVAGGPLGPPVKRRPLEWRGDDAHEPADGRIIARLHRPLVSGRLQLRIYGRTDRWSPVSGWRDIDLDGLSPEEARIVAAEILA